MTQRILFVCIGNICRSPSAHAVLRALRPDWQIDSAGTSDWHAGEAPYAPMQTAAKARGISMADLRARQVASADFDRFDLILAMDAQNLTRTEALRPTGNDTPVHLFTDYEGIADDHVPDPYYTRDFEGCLDLIEACAKGLVARLG
ncbi:low molecular weight protein-tyrosine-phosphatase [Lacimonas salitolerans]|uniref:protein-tyrosine-phosphatase n=1 Tax=Lacimonas salitolerans TaxID=1323750 RepID=A0ABW4EBE5_9RHOB